MATKPTKTKFTKDQLKSWYTEKIKSTAAYKQLMRDMVLKDYKKRRSLAVLGKMYIYEYDAKHKDTLPVWDRFPLMFPIERYDDGFLGLNLHYLSIPERHQFLEMLQDFMVNKKYNRHTRMRLTYGLMQKTKKLADLGRPCIHRYLYSQIRSPLIEIPGQEWELAAELPIELWVKKN
jgi:hypothetical protein